MMDPSWFPSWELWTLTIAVANFRLFHLEEVMRTQRTKTASTQKKDRPISSRESRYKDKPNLCLLPPEATWESALLLSQYSDRDADVPGWDLMTKTQCLKKYKASVLRHLWRWLRGEQVDQDSGRHHLAHVATNALILLEVHLRDAALSSNKGDCND